MVNVMIHVTALDGKCLRATDGRVHLIYRAWNRGTLPSLFWTYCRDTIYARSVIRVGYDEAPNCLKCVNTTEEEAGRDGEYGE